MRKMTLAVAASTVGALLVAAPAFAYTTYQIQTAETAAALNQQSSDDQPDGFNLHVTNTNAAGQTTAVPFANDGFTPQTQKNLSGDMSWQGTGYYLRPSN